MTEEREDAARAALEATVSLSLRVLRGAMGVLVLLFLGSSVFTVEQHEVALVRRLGSVVGAPDQRVLPPGAHWAWPVIDEVVRVAARRDERLATDTFQLEARVTDVVGKPPERKNGLDPERDGYLITGDANVLNATIAVQWTIDDAYAFSSRAREVPELARPLLERAIAKTAAAMPVDDLLASRKETFLEEVRAELQRSLDALAIGVRAGTVFLAKDFTPPPQARESFAAVTKAVQDRDTQISKARGEAAEVVGLARSEASRLRGEARSEAKRRTADVLADQAVFEALLPEWRRDPRAVKARLVTDALARSRPEEGFVVPPGEEVRVRLERDTKPAQQKMLERAR